MEVKNNAPRDLGLEPGIVVPRGGAIEIDNDKLTALKASPVVKAWFAEGDLVEVGAVPLEVDARSLAVQAIIRALVPDDFTKSGKPEVDAINDALEGQYDPVTAAERDEIWEAMQDEGA